jgi:hypothetical protein
MRSLKILVVAMGIMLVGGFALLVAIVASKLLRGDNTPRIGAAGRRTPARYCRFGDGHAPRYDRVACAALTSADLKVIRHRRQILAAPTADFCVRA